MFSTLAALALFALPGTRGEVLRMPIGKWQDFGFSWNPNGTLLGMNRGGQVSILEPKNHAERPLAKGQLLGWRPDGKAVLIGVGDPDREQSRIVNVATGHVDQVFPVGKWAWWLGNTSCQATRIWEPLKKGQHQTWMFGTEKRDLPAGLVLTAVSQDGHAMLLDVPGDYPMWAKHALVLWIVDDQGKLRWRKTILDCGRRDLAGQLDLEWNPKYQLAARTVDGSGGGTMLGYVDSKSRQTSLELIQSKQDIYFWVNDLDWIDDRNLFIQFGISITYQPDQKTSSGIYLNRLALYDGATGRIRPIYQSPSLLAATASAKYVAIVEGDAKAPSQDLVISEWKRDSEGRIVTSKYTPKDEIQDDEEDWTRFLQSPAPPLKSVRSGTR
jgi:hypothetical protein